MYRSVAQSSDRLPTTSSPSTSSGLRSAVSAQTRWRSHKTTAANTPSKSVIIIIVSIFAVTMLFFVYESITASGPHTTNTSHPAVKLALSFIFSDAKLSAHELELIKVDDITEKQQLFEGSLINTQYEFTLFLRELSSGVVLAHTIKVSTDSSSHSAITQYTRSACYKQILLRGSTRTALPESVSHHLRVLSFNLWNYNHWALRLPLIKEIFERLLPDVIAFQEVRAKKVSTSSTHRFQVEDLSNLLPDFQFVFEPAMTFHEAEDIVHEGLAIFSRYPILHTDVLLLSRDSDDGNDFHQRICLRALIDTPLGPVNVMSTHLSLSIVARQRTLPEIANYIDQLDDGNACIVMGDFNAESGAGVNLMQSYGFDDAWLSLHSTTHTTASRGWTFNSWFPKSRIDYVFSRGISPLYMSNEASVGVDSPGLPPGFGVNRPRDTLFVSDHYLPFVIFERNS